jgi:hypothetical protein
MVLPDGVGSARNIHGVTALSNLFERLSDKKRKDARVLADFVRIYCREQHRSQIRRPFEIQDPRLQSELAGLVLCEECTRLLEHGAAKLSLCPYEPKPSCRKCPSHCYAPGYREKVKKVMRFSGAYLVKRGRLDILLHYLH